MSDVTEEDIEAFIHDLTISIFDLSKKYNNICKHANLGNAMCQLLRFIKKIKEESNERKGSE